MASLLDRGDSYRVEYLGSAMLSQMSTGLGLIQKPLKDLYVRFRATSNKKPLQERHLMMTDRGMVVCYRDSPNSPTEEEFYAMPSILMWDAVRFVTVKGSDKKTRCAFEPLDNDHSRNKDNLFSPLEKKFHFLQQQPHPAMFMCVLRRTQGLKALDVHAYFCHNDQEAMGLVHALNMVHNNYTSDEIQETGVFGYNPFGMDSVRSTSGPLSPAGGARGPPPPGRHHQPPAGQPRHQPSSRTGSFHQQSHARGSPPPTRPKSERALKASARLSGSQPNLSHSGFSLPQDQANPRYFQLTQQDFSASPDSTLQTGTSQSQETYQYLDHINKTLERPPKDARTPHVDSIFPSGGEARGVERQPDRLGEGYSLLSGSHGPLPGYDPYRRRSPDSYNPSVPQHESSNELYERTLPRNGHMSPQSPEWGRGADPGWFDDRGRQHDNRGRYPDDRGPYQDDRERYQDRSDDRRPPHDWGNQPGARGSRISSYPTPVVPVHSQQSVNDPARDYPPSRYGQQSGYSPVNNLRQSTAMYEDMPSPKGLSVGGRKGSDNSGPPSGSQPTRWGAGDTAGSSGSRSSYAETPNRPVAMVTPQKVQGIRVLPPGAMSPAKPRMSPASPMTSPTDVYAKPTKQQRSPDDAPKARPRSAVYDQKQRNNDVISPVNKPESDYFYFGESRADRSERGSESSRAPNQASGAGAKKDKANWQFRPTQQDDYDYNKSLRPDEVNKNEKSSMNEKLLMNQKKDAEIASVMQNLRLDYDTPTLLPHAPHGTNFERSLGYFP